ncbi:MAG TPA: GNAT family N-acetyltransferase [Telluria sp.]|jgi:putative acetyltransferase
MLPGEEPALQQIFFRSVGQIAVADYGAGAADAWISRSTDPAQWHQRMQRNRPFVAVHDGVPAGFADLQPDGEIDMFFVDPDFSGKGVGALLLNAIHAEADASAIERLTAHVSITAQPFFFRHGFTVLRQQVVKIGEHQLRNAFMEKSLSQRGEGA